jgi:outer membrane protein OmpA-like peptidoglycan-associated protein
MRVVLLGLVLLVAACVDRTAVPPASQASAPLVPSYAVFFESFSSTLTPEARAVVADVAAKVRTAKPSTVLVEGYAGKPGSAAQNQLLSQERVDAVVKALAAAGVSQSDVLKIAKGERAAGLDPVGDRRVEITLQFAQ